VFQLTVRGIAVAIVQERLLDDETVIAESIQCEGHAVAREDTMGSKSHHNMQRDRPESGGANRDENLEKSGILERNRQKLETENVEAREQEEPPAPEDQADGAADADEKPG